jgi:hypothetical protein
MLRRTFVSLLVAFAAAAAASAQSADELIEKNLQARGGREKLKSVQSLRMSGKMMMGEMEAPFILEQKRPNSVRMEFTVQGMTGVQAYDGATGWAVMPFMGKKDPEKMSAEDLKDIEDQADMDGPLVDYKDKGHQVEYLGKKDIEGTPVHALKVSKKNGDVVTLYLDADAFLEIKAEGKSQRRGQEMEMEIAFGDYKEVGGILFAHSLDIKPKGAPAGQHLVIDKIELNPELASERFVMPAAAPADGAAKDGAPRQ